MKNTRFYSLLGAAAFTLLSAGTIYAQGPGGGGGMMGQPPSGGGGQGGGPGGPGGPGRPGGGDQDVLATLVRSLNLTNSQKTQVQPIVDAATPQIRAIREEATSKTESVVQSAEAQIKPLLNSYQQQVLASMEKNRAAMQANAPKRP